MKKYWAIVTRVQEMHLEIHENEIEEGSDASEEAWRIAYELPSYDWETINTNVDVYREFDDED